MVIARAVVIGMVVMLAGTIPRNLLFAANLRYLPSLPWAVPVTALYIWLFWRFLGQPGERRELLRANRVSGRAWGWALIAGGLGIVALVLALKLANRMVLLPAQGLPEFGGASRLTILSLLLMAAPVAGIIEEAAFRGYMQGPIERRHGLVVAILITGTMFAVAHLDFTLILWPYYLAVAAIYVAVAYLTNSILPAVVLHTSGNLYSNFDLWLHGRAEWQAAGPAELIWTTGADRSFWTTAVALAVTTTVTVWAYGQLARAARPRS